MIGYRVIREETLGEPYTSRIAAAAKASGVGSAVTQGNFGGEVGLAFVGLLLVVAAIGLVSMGSHTISRVEVGSFVIGSALLAFGVVRIRKRMRAKLSTFTLWTPAYTVTSDGGTLKVWNRALATGIAFHHNYHRGIYQNTVMLFQYEGEALAVGDTVSSPSDVDDHLLSQSVTFQRELAVWRTARAANEAGAFASLRGADLLPP